MKTLNGMELYGNKKGVVKRGEINGWNYVIYTCGYYPTAYVEIPEGHPVSSFNVNDALRIFEVSSEITFAGYMSSTIIPNSQGIEKAYFIGWDYGHSGDYQYFPFNPSLSSEGHKWTVPEIMEDVESVISTLNHYNSNKIRESKNHKNTKKNVKRINESQLKAIVAKSVKKVLNEDFRNVDNLSDYIRQNNIQMRQASKFARINAVQARGGERINTIASDGTQETTNVANIGDWIVNNVGNPQNKWIIDPQTFAKKYQPDPSQDGVYMPKGGPMMAGQINEPISFNAPWGERMNIDKGGYLMQTPGSKTDIYGISGPDFDNTYKFNESVIHLTQSDLRMIIESVVYHYNRSIDGRKKRQLNEKYYNPFREPLIDGNLNGYDVLDGAKEEQIICDLPEKGWVEDIRMYSMMRNQGKTYCLYRRVDNGKYFFTEVYDDLKDEKYLCSKAVPKKNVPDFILNDAISLIRHS